VLLVVGRHPGMSVTEAAHELGLAPNSVSTMVTQLVAAGIDALGVLTERLRTAGRGWP